MIKTVFDDFVRLNRGFDLPDSDIVNGEYLQPQDTYITIVFGDLVGDKVVTKGVYAKMARGEMVRFMAEIGVQHPQQIKDFDRGYRFDEKRSTDTEHVFIRNMDKSHPEE